MKTGTDVSRNGLYASDCCSTERDLHRNQVFPRCPKCMGLTKWTSVSLPAIDKTKKAA